MPTRSSKYLRQILKIFFLLSGVFLLPMAGVAAVTMQTGDETTLRVGDKSETQTSISSDEQGHSMRVVPPRQKDDSALSPPVIITPEIYWDHNMQQVRPPHRPHPPQKPGRPISPGKPDHRPGKNSGVNSRSHDRYQPGNHFGLTFDNGSGFHSEQMLPNAVSDPASLLHDDNTIRRTGNDSLLPPLELSTPNTGISRSAPQRPGQRLTGEQAPQMTLGPEIALDKPLRSSHQKHLLGEEGVGGHTPILPAGLDHGGYGQNAVQPDAPTPPTPPSMSCP